MAARAIWKGQLKLGTTKIAVKLYSAVQDKTVRFHILDEKAKALLRPLLYNPLRITGTRLAAAGGGNYVAASKDKFPNPFKR